MRELAVRCTDSPPTCRWSQSCRQARLVWGKSLGCWVASQSSPATTMENRRKHNEKHKRKFDRKFDRVIVCAQEVWPTSSTVPSSRTTMVFFAPSLLLLLSERGRDSNTVFGIRTRPSLATSRDGGAFDIPPAYVLNAFRRWNISLLQTP